jgi:hypothetical protein
MVMNIVEAQKNEHLLTQTKSVSEFTTLLDTTTTYYYSGTSASSVGFPIFVSPPISTAESILSTVSPPTPVQSIHLSSRSERSIFSSVVTSSTTPSLTLLTRYTERQTKLSHIQRSSSTRLVSKTRQITTDAPLANAGTRTHASQADTEDNAVLLGVLIPFSLILVVLLIFGAWLAQRWWRRRHVAAVILADELVSFDHTWARADSDDSSVQSYGFHEADGQVKLIELGGNARVELEGACARG